MIRRKKKRTVEIHPALVIAGIAFFAILTTYSLVKLNATISPEREFRHFEIGRAQNFTPPSAAIPAEPEPAVFSDEQNWVDAESVLVDYFAEINSGDYSAAIALRTPEYLVGAPESYSAQLRESMKNDISGKLKITNVERIESTSKSTTKFFRFRKDAIWSFDNSTHSEIRKAALVLRDGEWTIDYFELERRF